MMTTLEDVWQPETGRPVVVNEENGWLKCTALDVAVNIDFIGRGPAPLGNDGASSCFDTVVQWQGGSLCRNRWRWCLHTRRISHEVPYPLRV